MTPTEDGAERQVSNWNLPNALTTLRIVMVPFFAEQENPKLDVVAGDIGYYPGRQTICLFVERARSWSLNSSASP